MLRTDKRTIDGLDFTTTQLPAMVALGLVPRLGRVVAPTISRLSTMAGADDVGPALAELFASLDASEAQSLARDLLRATTVVVDGRQLPLDRDEMINAAFGGKLATMMKALWFVVQTNFADFLKAASVASGSKTSDAVKEPTPAS